MSRFFRLGHFKDSPFVKVGDYVTPQTVIDLVGSTGHSTGPHVHLDGTKTKPVSWFQYQNRPLSEYFDTEPFAKRVLPYPRMYIASRHGRYNGLTRHIGVDLNVAPQDLGLKVYAPCFGRVAFVAGTQKVWDAKRRQYVLQNWNGGFGNMLWIEVDETREAKGV